MRAPGKRVTASAKTLRSRPAPEVRQRAAPGRGALRPAAPAGILADRVEVAAPLPEQAAPGQVAPARVAPARAGVREPGPWAAAWLALVAVSCVAGLCVTRCRTCETGPWSNVATRAA